MAYYMNIWASALGHRDRHCASGRLEFHLALAGFPIIGLCYGTKGIPDNFWATLASFKTCPWGMKVNSQLLIWIALNLCTIVQWLFGVTKGMKKWTYHLCHSYVMKIPVLESPPTLTSGALQFPHHLLFYPPCRCPLGWLVTCFERASSLRMAWHWGCLLYLRKPESPQSALANIRKQSLYCPLVFAS